MKTTECVLKTEETKTKNHGLSSPPMILFKFEAFSGLGELLYITSQASTDQHTSVLARKESCSASRCSMLCIAMN